MSNIKKSPVIGGLVFLIVLTALAFYAQVYVKPRQEAQDLNSPVAQCITNKGVVKVDKAHKAIFCIYEGV